MLQLTSRNTEVLSRVADLSRELQTIERELNNTQTGSQSAATVHLSDSEPAQKQEMEERNRLVQLVKLQAREIDALKMEISMLRHKGGHVYTPAITRTSIEPPPIPSAVLTEEQTE